MVLNRIVSMNLKGYANLKGSSQAAAHQPFFQGKDSSHETQSSFSIKEDQFICHTPIPDQQLLEKYGLNPDEVSIFPSDAQVPNKQEILIQYLKTHELAQKNAHLGNFSNQFKSSAIQLADGSWTLGTNLEHDRDNIFCGERSAMVSAWNQHLDKTPMSALKDSQDIKAIRDQQQVKWMVMGSQILADNDSGMPCSECQSWMSEQRYFTPETKIATLRSDPSTGKPFLLVRSLKQMLPLNGLQQPSLTHEPIDSLPLSFSMRAQLALPKKNISPEQVRETLKLAKEAYEQNEFADMSKKNIGAAALLSNGMARPSARLDWTRRWFTPPDIAAATRAFYTLPEKKGSWHNLLRQTLELFRDFFKPILPKRLVDQLNDWVRGLEVRIIQKQGEQRVNLIVYYGEEPTEMPPIASLGLLAQPAHGGPDTLIGVIEKEESGQEVIRIRTIEDYMPFIYISRSSLKKH